MSLMYRLRALENTFLFLVIIQSIYLHYDLDMKGSYLHLALPFMLTVLIVGVLTFHHWRRQLVLAYILCLINSIFLFFDGIIIIPAWYVYVQALLWTGAFVISTLLFHLPLFPPLSKDATHRHIGCITECIDGMDCRIFYPALEAPSHDKLPNVPFSHHGLHLAIGLGRFVSMPSFLFANTQNGFLSAKANAPVQPPPPPTTTKMKKVNRQGGSGGSGGWPVVIFSHGLGGALELYSSLLEQMASEGMINIYKEISITNTNMHGFKKRCKMLLKYTQNTPIFFFHLSPSHKTNIRNIKHDRISRNIK
jgi:hypothetical protein